MDSQTPSPNVNEINKTAIKKGAISLSLIFVIMVSVLLLTAGRWNWWEAWAYAAMSLVVLISSRAYLLIKRPEMAVERARGGEQRKRKALG